jgi:hypothetical protein
VEDFSKIGTSIHKNLETYVHHPRTGRNPVEELLRSLRYIRDTYGNGRRPWGYEFLDFEQDYIRFGHEHVIIDEEGNRLGRVTGPDVEPQVAEEEEVPGSGLDTTVRFGYPYGR